ncbi:MAG: hypothetical protein H6695_20535 [Deferribacteres bacterium]|nr:hypothetical protein [candidate division KSB1 bacterium]MCB9512573.1 hypothetical protein [Deferribacteres bacterium]
MNLKENVSKVKAKVAKGDIAVGKLSIMAEFWQFLRVRKKYWLAPIMIFLLLLSALIVFTQQSALAPFIYTLF